jgi:NAD(P)-dependent dehydrogenase (short-subunit alcohol dehydrogenase family)
MDTLSKFRLDGRIAIITGGAGLLGVQQAQVIAEAGGIPVLWDIKGPAAAKAAQEISANYGVVCLGMAVDITLPEAVRRGLEEVMGRFGRVNILINNAANDPKVSPGADPAWSRLENFGLDLWLMDMAVGLTGAFLCSKEIGSHMARQGGGVILNIASDLGVIAPDQRIYRREGLSPDQQPVKPVTYSVIKHGLIGLTKYLATYWATHKVRVNALSPGGVFTHQPEDFVGKLTGLIPLGRMAELDEYQAAVLFLISDASSYMTGANLVVDGGRTTW